MGLQLWSPLHPDGQGLLLVKRPDLIRKLNVALHSIRNMETQDLWVNLRKHEVMDGPILTRCKVKPTSYEQVEEIVEAVKKAQVWTYHAFLKALADTTGCEVHVETINGPGTLGEYKVSPSTTHDQDQGFDEPDVHEGATGGEPSSSEEVRGLQFLESQDYKWIQDRFDKLQKLGGAAGNPVKVAVLDNMVNRKYLPDVEIINCGPKLPSSYKEDSHGTNCAGIIRKCAPGVGIVNYHVSKYNTKTKKWKLKTPSIIKALKEIENRADISIISMSFGAPNFDGDEAEVLERLATKKILVAAASNRGWTQANTIDYPAKLEYVIAVGSCNRHGKEAGHSPVGEELDFLMPGLDVEVAKIMEPAGSGTSYATPHLAAAAALILKAIESSHGPQTRNRLTNTEDMRKLLIGACEGQPEHNEHRGHGLPDLNLVDEEFLRKYIIENPVSP